MGRLHVNSWRRAGAALARPQYSHADLLPLFNARSYAVVGASTNAGSFGAKCIRNILGCGSGVNVVGVNAKHEVVESVPCYPTLTDIPVQIDCAVLAVPGASVMSTLREAARAGTRSAVVFSAGFGETGRGSRLAEEEEMRALAVEARMPILGPNTLGYYDFGRRVAVTFAPAACETLADAPLQRAIGLVSQSGGVGYLMAHAQRHGLGFTHLLTCGNSADVDVADCLNFLIDDDETRVIALLFEGIRDGRGLVAAAVRARSRGKVVLVYKTGRSPEVARVTQSHTGTLSGDHRVYSAAFASAGMISVDSVGDLVDAAAFHGKVAGRPIGTPGVAVVGSSGGTLVMAADAAATASVDLPPIADSTAVALADLTPDFAALANPLDLTSSVLTKRAALQRAIEGLATDPAVGAVVIPLTMDVYGSSSENRPREILAAAANASCPICVVWFSTCYSDPALENLRRSSVPTFMSVASCFRTLREWFAASSFSEEPIDRLPVAMRHRLESHVQRLLSGGDGEITLTESQGLDLVDLLDIRTADRVLATSSEEAVNAGAVLGYPVVAKVSSPEIIHKARVGGVMVNLSSDEQLASAFDEIRLAARTAVGDNDAGDVLIERMVNGQFEMFVGARRDPQFGPVVVCGLGGSLVEVLDDNVVVLAPLGRQSARSALEALRVAELLSSVQLDQVARVVAKVAALIDEIPQLDELDINPLVVGESGEVTAVDAYCKLLGRVDWLPPTLP